MFCNNPGKSTMFDTFQGKRKTWSIHYTFDNSTSTIQAGANKTDAAKVLEMIVATNDKRHDTYDFDLPVYELRCQDGFRYVVEECLLEGSKDRTVGGCYWDENFGIGYCLNLYQMIAGYVVETQHQSVADSV